jgi:hypothetical protein
MKCFGSHMDGVSPEESHITLLQYHLLLLNALEQAAIPSASFSPVLSQYNITQDFMHINNAECNISSFFKT